MKYTITTKDETAVQMMLNAQKYHSALSHITYNIRRNYLKYGDYSESEYEILEQVFDEIARHLTDENINLNLD